VSTDGVDDPAALLAANRRALLTDGFEIAVERSRRSTLGNEAKRTRVHVTAAPGAGRYRVQANWTSRIERGRSDTWAGPNASREVVRTLWRTVDDDAGGTGGAADTGDAFAGVEPRVTRTRRAVPTSLTYTRWVEPLLTRGDFGLATVERRSGRRAYVYTADEYVPVAAERVEADQLGYDATLVVDEAGRIHSFRATVVRVETTSLGTRRTVASVAYRLVGTGPEAQPVRPWWLDRVGDDAVDVAGADVGTAAVESGRAARSSPVGSDDDPAAGDRVRGQPPDRQPTGDDAAARRGRDRFHHHRARSG
jgi:hypothetical protein